MYYIKKKLRIDSVEYAAKFFYLFFSFIHLSLFLWFWIHNTKLYDGYWIMKLDKFVVNDCRYILYYIYDICMTVDYNVIGKHK